VTHSSFANEHPPGTHHEALALLGDAVLSLCVAQHLYGADPDAGVGDLTSRRAEIVSDANLARWAALLELGELLRLGRGEEQTGGRTRASILATTLEAVLGVVYHEAGLDTARAVIARLAGW
jgi:ribonuclease-3